jgi:hypothetical protein
MPVALSVRIDTRATTRALSIATKQIPFALATAVNDLAFQVQRAENAAMTEVFKHPRPFTAKSVQVDKATKTSLSATVFVRPEVAKYLAPYEQGGLHVLPGKGLTLLNPKNVTLDQYGQLGKKTLDRLAARPDVFIGPVRFKGGKVVSGVWQRIATKAPGRRGRGRAGTAPMPLRRSLKLLIRFGNALPVTKRLNFHARAVALIAAKAGAALTNAVAKALSTTR